MLYSFKKVMALFTDAYIRHSVSELKLVLNNLNNFKLNDHFMTFSRRGLKGKR